jgi:hemerythrin-like domain-containing protein
VKRSEALASLSRDHHQALAVAVALRRATDADDARARFLEFWEREGAFHFRIEEEVLLPNWARMGSVDAAAAARLAQDHLEIRSAAVALTAEARSLTALHELGEKLSAHVRFEERELFPLIEADLSAPALEDLARVVAEAEGRS